MKLTIMLCFALLIAPLSSSAASNNTAPTIMVTLPPLSGLLLLLLPEVQSQCLLQANADPHHFQPSPRQVDRLQHSALIIRASHDDQGWALHIPQEKSIDLWASHAHAWLNFDLVRQALPTLAAKLAQHFPQYRQRLPQRLNKALKRVNAMELLWDKVFANIQHQGVFMQHPAWQNLFQAKAVPIWAVLESSQHGHEHGPQHLEQALHTLKKHPQAVFLGSKRHSNRSLAWLSRQQQPTQPIIELDAIGNCNQAWDVLMQKNLEALSSQQ